MDSKFCLISAYMNPYAEHDNHCQWETKIMNKQMSDWVGEQD